VQERLKSVGAASVRSGDAAGFRLEFISLLAAGIGLLAGVIAYVLYNLIGLITNVAFYHQFSTHFRSPEANHLGGWVILLPVVGGLIVGFMAKFGSSKIKGHGIPEAMEAVLTSRSRIEAKVAILKPISAAIAIGTGGPFGAEGPIIQTGGAVGSLIGQFISTTASERKVLLACGAGAGMAATFNTPLAGVVLAIELLLLEFPRRSRPACDFFCLARARCFIFPPWTSAFHPACRITLFSACSAVLPLSA
jgi:chloride channel protein, CIC family